jgi:hypothetical protein
MQQVRSGKHTFGAVVGGVKDGESSTRRRPPPTTPQDANAIALTTRAATRAVDTAARGGGILREARDASSGSEIATSQRFALSLSLALALCFLHRSSSPCAGAMQRHCCCCSRTYVDDESISQPRSLGLPASAKQVRTCFAALQPTPPSFAPGDSWEVKQV